MTPASGSTLGGGTRSALGRPVRIGITGPIGCGKSTIAAWLGERGAMVIDADQLARAVVEPGERALAQVLAAFGPTVVGANGELDRAVLADLVFREPAELARLEAIVHPAVRQRILAAMADADQSAAPAIVIEAIKLIDGGLAELCDEVWLVRCGAGIQLERLSARGGDPAGAALRVRAQAGLTERASRVATRELDTSGDLESTRQTALAAYDAAVSRSA